MSIHNFYIKSLKILNEHKIDFLLGGAHALQFYTGIQRDTKDLDIFCLESDYPAISRIFIDQGYGAQMADERWIGKIFHQGYFIDLIFNSYNSLCPVVKDWFDDAQKKELFGIDVKIPSPETMFLTKLYIKHRDRYDGADLNHLILKQGHIMNWSSLLQRTAGHHQLILAQILEFLFVYPSQQKQIPDWVFKELMSEAAQARANMANLSKKICRGPLIDRRSYDVDVLKWGFETFYD